MAGREIICEPPVRRDSEEGYVVVLRPERIRVARPNEGSDLGPVTVVSTTYKGREVEVETRLLDGQPLKFLISADQELAVPRSGQQHRDCLAPHETPFGGGNGNGRSVTVLRSIMTTEEYES